MTKTDEFIKKLKRLDPHLTVDKYHNLYGRDHSKVDMIIWYRKDIDTVMPFAFITYLHVHPQLRQVTTLQIKIIQLCIVMLLIYVWNTFPTFLRRNIKDCGNY